MDLLPFLGALQKKLPMNIFSTPLLLLLVQQHNTYMLLSPQHNTYMLLSPAVHYHNDALS